MDEQQQEKKDKKYWHKKRGNNFVSRAKRHSSTSDKK